MEGKNDCYYKCRVDRTKYNRRDAGTRERGKRSKRRDEAEENVPGEPGGAELDVK